MSRRSVVLPEPLGPITATFCRRARPDRSPDHLSVPNGLADAAEPAGGQFVAPAASISVCHGRAKRRSAGPHKHRRRQAQSEEDQAHERDRLEITEGSTGLGECRPEELEDRDGRQKGRVLEHADQVVAERGDDRRNRLRQDHSPPGLDGREIEHDRRLPLSARDALDARAVDLGRIAAVVEAQREHAGRERVECQAVDRQDVEEEKELRQQRRAPDELDIRPGGECQWTEPRHSHDGQQRAAHDGDRHPPIVAVKVTTVALEQQRRDLQGVVQVEGHRVPKVQTGGQPSLDP